MWKVMEAMHLSFSHLHQISLNSCSEPGSLLGPGDTEMNKATSLPPKAHRLAGEMDR